MPTAHLSIAATKVLVAFACGVPTLAAMRTKISAEEIDKGSLELVNAGMIWFNTDESRCWLTDAGKAEATKLGCKNVDQAPSVLAGAPLF